ncbi:hypothetical protein SD80_032535 [Scytonema tolypothrichoides VB-61278]|nr:hypothetical protein SD80_032535 [Scytonema tolypothrichoides VB-61278]
MHIFVPGRLCLFGEHSDWAGGYRRHNPKLEVGYTLLVGTNQGLSAHVQPHLTQFILHTCVSDGTRKPVILPMEKEALLTQVYEKPSIDYARQHLRIEGMADDEFLCIFGLYVLTPKIFDFLEEHIHQNFRERGEFQLTSCLDRVCQEEGMTGYVVKGKCFDTGLPDAYRQTMIDFRI